MTSWLRWRQGNTLVGYYLFSWSIYAIMRTNYESYICSYNTSITFYFASGIHYDTSVANYAM
jgi:hypothetical protein